MAANVTASRHGSHCQLSPPIVRANATAASQGRRLSIRRCARVQIQYAMDRAKITASLCSISCRMRCSSRPARIATALATAQTAASAASVMRHFCESRLPQHSTQSFCGLASNVLIAGRKYTIQLSHVLSPGQPAQHHLQPSTQPGRYQLPSS